jgi:transposase
MPGAAVAASPAAGFTRAGLTTLSRLGEPGPEVTGQRLGPGRAVLACRVPGPGQWCRRCGCEGLAADTVIRQPRPRTARLAPR